MTLFAQGNIGKIEYLSYWENLDQEFRNPDTSPLQQKDLEDFDSIPRFQYDPDFRLTATFKPVKRSKPFRMKTTGKSNPNYVKVGVLDFIIENDTLELSVYRNLDLERTQPGEEFVFIPFTDGTNGVSTYGGGRYLDFEFSEDEEYFIDFNQAYNPYCAYNYKYSCPIPPAENNLDIEISAGARSD